MTPRNQPKGEGHLQTVAVTKPSLPFTCSAFASKDIGVNEEENEKQETKTTPL